MSTENRVVDLVIDENVPYGLLMQFFDVDESVYPNTETPINLTGFSLKGVIKTSLDASAPTVATFNTAVIDAAQGVATISLPVEAVKALGLVASPERDKYNMRQRFVGYYDIIMSRNGSAPARIMEGKVYISDGVTV